MEKKLNFLGKCYDRSLVTFILSFVFCFAVVILNCFAFGEARNGILSLFESYYDAEKPSPSSNWNSTSNLHRNSSNLSVTTHNRSSVDPCSGQYIYVYDLPRRFNEELLQRCRAILKWPNLCPFVVNSGLGPKVKDLRGILPHDGWYATNQFFLGPIFRARMRQYRCLTNDSSLASAIYVPFFPGLDVSRHLWGSNVSVRDALAHELARWVSMRSEWKRVWGRDHFVVSGRIAWDLRRITEEDSEWGNNFMNLPESNNMTFMSIESTQWSNEFAIPYPTYFHPSTSAEVSQWQERMRKRKRKYLFSFAGAPRPNSTKSIRSELIKQCARASSKGRTKKTCFLLACKLGDHNKCEDPVEIVKAFQDSVFCLQPQGDSYTRRSAFDSILAGCIPVFFHPGSFYGQYSWYLPRNYTKYSVFIPEGDVRNRKVNIRRRLMSIPRDEVRAMREEMIRMIPRIVYANPGNGRSVDFEDAFDVAVKKVLERIEKVRMRISQGKDPSVGFSDWDDRRFDLPVLD